MIRPPGQLTEGIFQEVLGKSIPSLLKSKPSASVPASDVATALNRHMAMEAGGYSPMTVQPLYNASGQVPLKSSATPLETALGMPHGPGRVHSPGNPRSAESAYKRELDYQTGNVHPAGMTQEELESVRSRSEGLSPEKMEQLLDPTQVTAGGGKLAPQGTFSSLENLDQEAVAYQSGLRSEEMKNRAQSIADIVASRSKAKVQHVTDANARISKADQNLQAYENMKAEASELDPNQLLGGGNLLPSSPSATHQQLLNEIDNEIIGGVKELYSATAAKGNILNTELNLLHGSGDPLIAQMNRLKEVKLEKGDKIVGDAGGLPVMEPTIFSDLAKKSGVGPSRVGKLLEDPKGYSEVAHNATNANVVEEVAGVTNPNKADDLFGVYDPTRDPVQMGGLFGALGDDSAKGLLASAGIGAGVGAIGAYMTGGEASDGMVMGGIAGLGVRGISGAINANAAGIQRGMYKKILGEGFDSKMTQDQLRGALRDVNKETLNMGQKAMYGVLANPNKSSVGFSLRAQTLSGGFLAGAAFSSRRNDKRRGFNAHRGNRI